MTKSSEVLAEVARFELTNVGVKDRCLRPLGYTSIYVKVPFEPELMNLHRVKRLSELALCTISFGEL